MEDQTQCSTKRPREQNREEYPRKKHISDSGEIMKARNEKRKEKKVKPIFGDIKFYTKTEEEKIAMFSKLDRAKLVLKRKISEVSNREILSAVLDFFLDTYEENSTEIDADNTSFSQYLHCDRDKTQEDMFFVTKSAIKNLSTGIQLHDKNCSKMMTVKEVQRSGHVGKITFMCADKHTFKCDTSQHIEGGQFLANLRMLHAIFGSGLRYSQYERMAQAAKFGVCAESYFENAQHVYCEITSKVANESIKRALEEEEARTKSNCTDEDYKGIGIMSDARHGWRKNAKQSDVIAIGSLSHRVIGAVTVTHEEEPCSQKHELTGAKKLYAHFQDQNVTVHVHGHDRILSLNKYLEKEHPHITNANDT